MRHKCTKNFQKSFEDQAQIVSRPVFVLILMREFEKRMERNPRYSLRAFARHLDLDLGHLSRVFRGERVPRKSTGVLICEKLTLDETDKEEFLKSIASENFEKYKKMRADETAGSISPAVPSSTN